MHIFSQEKDAIFPFNMYWRRVMNLYINSLALELFTFFVMNVWCFRFILNFNYLDKAYLCVEDFKKGKNWKNGALNFSKKIKPKSWPEYRFHLEYKNSYFLHWNFDWKSCFVVFFLEWNEWKNPFNFSSQNLSIERNFFKWDGKETKILHLLFHRIWKKACM